MEENLKEKQKQEAIKRIEKLKNLFDLDSKMLEFINGENGALLIDFIGYTESPENHQKISNLVKEFNSKYNVFSYYYNICNMEFNGIIEPTLNIFYVGSKEEEYSQFWYYIDQKETMVYSVNLNMPDYPEFGYITLEKVDGELARKG